MLRTLPTSQHHIQTAIIGAGIIGLSIARSLAKKGHEILILEQSNMIGSGISSRNSEVIHAGIYYDPATMPLKSKFCVEGKQLMYEYCREREIPHKRCGKLLVATDAKQRDLGLPQLVESAKRNGVNDLRVVSKEEISDPYSDVYEPNVVCFGGVFSPSTGIVDSHALVTSLLAEAEEGGTTLALHCNVEGGGTIPDNNGNAENRGLINLTVDGSEISCDNVIVCAGLNSDRIASSIISKMTPSPLCNPLPKQYYAKGNYFKLENQKSPFSRLIYPLPDLEKGGLGVHATIDLSGSTRFGPDVEWLPDNTNADEIDFTVDPNRSNSFYGAVKKYFPDLKDGNLVPDYSGIRTKLVHPNVVQDNVDQMNLKDFFIAGPQYHGVKGLFVLLGIESPGLTSSLAIGEHVAKMMP